MERNYIAFISYRHLPLEMETAKKLHRRIEHFRIPKELRRDGADRLGLVFRDQEELPISSNLSANIEEALDHSEYLIVICSPETVKSRWVLGEIDYFLRSHPRDRVLAVLAAGTPEEAFPPQLTCPEEDGGLPIEPLAANIVTDSAVKRARLFQRESLRILAALIGCPFDALYQREVRYQRRRRSAVSAAIGITTAAFIGLLLNRNAQIRAQLEKTQINESVALAVLSERTYWEGNYNGALEYALQALPSEGNKRPYVPAAELALSGEVNVYRQGMLSYDCSFEQDSAILLMAISQSGKHLATADSTGGIWLFEPDVNTLKWHVQTDRITTLAFAGEESVVMSGIFGTEVRRVEDGSLRWRTEQTNNLNLLAFSQDGQLLLKSDYADPACEKIEELSLVSVLSGETLQRISLSDHEPRPCAAAAFNADANCTALILPDNDSEASLVLCDFSSSSAQILRENLPYSAGCSAYGLRFTPGGDLALACDNMDGVSFVMLFDAKKDWDLHFETEIETEKIAQVVNDHILTLAALDYFEAGEEHLVVASKHNLMMLTLEDGGIVWQRTLPGIPVAAKMYDNETMGLILSDGTITACTPDGVLTYTQDVFCFSSGYAVYTGKISGDSYSDSSFFTVSETTPGRVSVVRFVNDPSMSLLAELPDNAVRFVLLPSPSGERIACMIVDITGEVNSWTLLDAGSHTATNVLPFPGSLPQNLSRLTLQEDGMLAVADDANYSDLPQSFQEVVSVR